MDTIDVVLQLTTYNQSYGINVAPLWLFVCFFTLKQQNCLPINFALDMLRCCYELFEPTKAPSPRAQLFERRLAFNPGLNLTQVSFSFVQKHFLG